MQIKKKWPRTKRGLERYYAHVCLICDNCRLFNKDEEVRF